MQSIEVIIYFLFAVMIGFLVISFIVGFDFGSIQESLTEILGGPQQDQNKFEKITYYAFLDKVSECWKACNFGKEDRDCALLHIVPAEEQDYGMAVSQATLEADFKKFNICEDCKLSLNPASIEIPSTVQLGCSKASKSITINS